ncbi:FAD-binding domain-containing protein [Emericellopsis atlantica]|uniref:FAD-binding domain-containing protein n=1 Tax=Emericellopsis atlantica TaxID=2614577 RepID=A0A9P7ZRF1_9HYPO|nr:FAD-binding domain-containing protein [Emericellopsis atlantica]KAG9256278.1 FAD-binding domain-containing protein [Emericellopsis atlantica]
MSPPREEHRASFADHPIRSADKITYLSEDEISQFLDDLDRDGDGYINYAEVEHKLDQAHDELVPKPAAHNIFASRRPAKDDKEGLDGTNKARHAFLRQIMGGQDTDKIPRDEFAQLMRDWKIPSLQQAKKEEEDEKGYFRKLPSWRKVRAYWAVHGPEIVFLGLVVAMQLAFAVWQLVKYLTTPPYTAGFGWGVVLAKTSAGALYPTFFFLLLSMSRYFSTLLRRSYLVSRFLNWDLSQDFHIRISCVTIVLASVHAVGHLAGSFRYGSMDSRQDAVEAVLGRRMHYIDFVRTLPGVTGLTALGLMYVLSLLSIPPVRRWNYEVFQLGHLLMYPIVGLMMAHGTRGLFQWPMFGYFLAFPMLLILVERFVRIVLGFYHITATLKVLDGETVEITTDIPTERIWKYKAGQYIFLMVPALSYFEWHPFTVSFCRGKKMRVHIKTDGNWTAKLRGLGGESGQSQIKIAINGPFGAPAQRFYDFSHSVIIGAGIGVTPFSGILADLQYNDDLDHGGPSHNRPVPEQDVTKIPEQEEKSNDPPQSENRPRQVTPDLISRARNPQPTRAASFADDYRRVDFHWMVRDRNYLLWLSDLLNEVSLSQVWHRAHEDHAHLDIRINTHVTAKRNGIVTHVYRWLLEMHRTEDHPASPLTGLLNPTHYGRPDFDLILDEHYAEMVAYRASLRQARQEHEGDATRDDSSSESTQELEDEEFKVGVFYCGAPVVGEILADKCAELTTRGREDGTKIEYHFMIEVFG